VITDLHFREAVPGEASNPRREGRRVGELLERCLEEMRAVDVQLLVCLGDCVDDERQPGALDDLAALAHRLEAGGLP